MRDAFMVIWFAGMATTPFVAHWKGRNKIGWSLAAIPIGLPVPVVLACLKNKRPQMGECPYCFSRIPAASSVCRQCRRDVTPAVPVT